MNDDSWMERGSSVVKQCACHDSIHGRNRSLVAELLAPRVCLLDPTAWIGENLRIAEEGERQAPRRDLREVNTICC